MRRQCFRLKRRLGPYSAKLRISFGVPYASRTPFAAVKEKQPPHGRTFASITSVFLSAAQLYPRNVLNTFEYKKFRLSNSDDYFVADCAPQTNAYKSPALRESSGSLITTCVNQSK